ADGGPDRRELGGGGEAAGAVGGGGGDADDVRQAGGGGAFEHGRQLGAEAVVVEVGVRVEQGGHGGPPASRRVHPGGKDRRGEPGGSLATDDRVRRRRLRQSL